MKTEQILCDLHTHTTASDGQHAPGELVQLAKCRAAVQELEDMGVEGEGIDALNAELDGK